MHYKNGREAKNGDKVVRFPAYAGETPVVGILYDAVAGNDYCNGKLALIAPNDPLTNLKECLHLDDVLKALPATVPDARAVVDQLNAAHAEIARLRARITELDPSQVPSPDTGRGRELLAAVAAAKQG